MAFRAQVRDFEGHLQAQEELKKLEAREAVRKPATEAARDRYMALREFNQAQIRNYWKTVEAELERNHKANEEWAREHPTTAPPAPAPVPETPPEADVDHKSDGMEKGGRD
jgi:hypothetical protein